MKTGTWDAIIIGGGHNGLVTAAYLGRAGLKVLLLEAGNSLGGGAAAVEVHPGYRVPGLGAYRPALDRRAVRDLGVPQLGSAQATHTTVALLGDGESVAFGPDVAAAARSIERYSPQDAAAWPAFHARMQAHAGTLRTLFESTPPSFDFSASGNLGTFARLGWSLRRRGKTPMRDLLRIITMNVADLAEDTFESDAVRGVIALDAVLGNNHGPRSPNTVFTYLHRWFTFGGSRPAGGRPDVDLAETLAAAARKAGVEIRTDARVGRVLVEAGHVRGVELTDGSVLEASVVVSGADPVSTLADLVEADHLDADFRREVRHIRCRGMTGVVHFALDRRPDLPGCGEEYPARWVIAPNLDYVERAFDQAKYGDAVDEPALEIVLPSDACPGSVPRGKHLMSVNVAYAPYDTTGKASAGLVDRVTRVLESRMPGFSEQVLAAEGWGPAEIEQRFGVSGGHWHHGDIALDQYFNLRPVAGFAQYRTPISGLYLCSAGTHPGGGLNGINGTNAAREILADRKQRRQVA